MNKSSLELTALWVSLAYLAAMIEQSMELTLAMIAILTGSLMEDQNLWGSEYAEAAVAYPSTPA